MADTDAYDIPVVDFGDCGLNVSTEHLDFTSKKLQGLADKIFYACSTVGFVYLRNHGIHEAEIKEVSNKVDEFLRLPVEVKEKYERSAVHGWVRLERERPNPQRPGDLKECYNATPAQADPINWPDEVVPDFKKQIMTFFNRCDSLAHRVLKILALGLNMEVISCQIDAKDLDVFTREHNVAKNDNCSTLRLLYYPPVTMDVKPGQIRLGEHTDYGTITLLFQDNVGGLEVQRPDGKWVPATPIPDTILVNIADAMQRWTSDRLVSTPHRVFIPDDAEARNKERRSIAYFVVADEDCLITCIDGSDKYPPITCKDFLKARFKESY